MTARTDAERKERMMAIPAQDSRIGDKRDPYEGFVSHPAAGVHLLAGDNKMKRDLVIRTLRAAAQFDTSDWQEVQSWLDDQP